MFRSFFSTSSRRSVQHRSFTTLTCPLSSSTTSSISTSSSSSSSSSSSFFTSHSHAVKVSVALVSGLAGATALYSHLSTATAQTAACQDKATNTDSSPTSTSAPASTTVTHPAASCAGGCDEPATSHAGSILYEYYTQTGFPSGMIVSVNNPAWDLLSEETRKLPMWFRKHLHIVGAPGLRCMYGDHVCIVPQARAYSFALYIDEQTAKQTVQKVPNDDRKVLSKYRPLFTTTEDILSTMPAHQKLLLNNEFDKSIRLVFVQNTHSEYVSSRLIVKMKQRLELRNDQTNREMDNKAVDFFHRVFSGQPLKKGDEAIFTWTKQGLQLSVHGNNVGLIPSQAVAWAFFELFIGPQAVSPHAQKEINAAFDKKVQHWWSSPQ